MELCMKIKKQTAKGKRMDFNTESTNIQSKRKRSI